MSKLKFLHPEEAISDTYTEICLGKVISAAIEEKIWTTIFICFDYSRWVRPGITWCRLYRVTQGIYRLQRPEYVKLNWKSIQREHGPVKPAAGVQAFTVVLPWNDRRSRQSTTNSMPHLGLMTYWNINLTSSMRRYCMSYFNARSRNTPAKEIDRWAW